MARAFSDQPSFYHQPSTIRQSLHEVYQSLVSFLHFFYGRLRSGFPLGKPPHSEDITVSMDSVYLSEDPTGFCERMLYGGIVFKVESNWHMV